MRLDLDLILRKLADATRHYGKFPTQAEQEMYRQIDRELPSKKTLHRHFKSIERMSIELRAWSTERPEYADVLALLPEAASMPSGSAARDDGFVYLIRSGAFYKIGRSEELERRVKEIRIALPDAATLAHAIRTDDPAGIEAYWHRRFADRRANGEWFKLAPADVAAFKRRKYQ